jgi:hypothetical protein
MIGKIERIPIRDIWRNEARGFTGWLFDNIEVLAEELDIGLSSIDKEKSVGSFSADIVAEDTTGNSVLIENQLEKTDHDHLGKILTYISNLEAKTAIWISSNPRPEHERAIEWLNEAGVDVDFYLVKIEIYKIGESEPAPKFTIIAGPSEKSKAVGKEKKELAERHKKRLDFWKMLLERSKEKTKLFSNVSPSIYSWIGTGSGKSGLTFNYVVTYRYGQVELYIDRGKDSEEENKKIFDQLYKDKDEIEKSFPFGEKLKWQRLDDRRASRICKTFEYAGLNDKEKWEKLQDDMIDTMIEFHKAFKKHIKKL